MKNIISVNELKFFGNEKVFLNRCIDEKWVSSDGPFIISSSDSRHFFLQCGNSVPRLAKEYCYRK